MTKASQHQQESLKALYQSIKYCEEQGLPCNQIYTALHELETDLRKNREANKKELETIERIVWPNDDDLFIDINNTGGKY